MNGAPLAPGTWALPADLPRGYLADLAEHGLVVDRLDDRGGWLWLRLLRPVGVGWHACPVGYGALARADVPLLSRVARKLAERDGVPARVVVL